MGAGVICAASSPPAIEVVRGCAERVGQELLGVPRSSDPRVTDKDERFLNEARVRARARDARRGREASPADQTRTSDRFRRVVRRPVHRVVAVALRRHGGALSRAPRSARTLLAPEDKFELRTSSALQVQDQACQEKQVSFTFHLSCFHAREKTVGFPIDHDSVSSRVARAGARWAPRLRGASGMSRTTRETMRAGKTCVFPSPLPVSTHPARDDPRTAAFSATATLMTHASTLPDPFPPHSTTLQRRRARPTLRAHHVRVGEARVHGSGPARRRGRRRAFRSTPRLGSRWDPDPDRVRLALRKKREDARGFPPVRVYRRQTRARARGPGAGRPRAVRGRQRFVRLRGYRATHLKT